MIEQYGDVPPRTASAPADMSKNPPAVRPTELSSAEIQSRPQGDAMSDPGVPVTGAELDEIKKDLHLSQLRFKLLRIEGHKELSTKQQHAALQLVREIADIETPNWREDVMQIFK